MAEKAKRSVSRDSESGRFRMERTERLHADHIEIKREQETKELVNIHSSPRNRILDKSLANLTSS